MFFAFDGFDRNHNPRFYALSPYETFALREYVYTPIGWVGENSNFYKEVLGERVSGYLNDRIRFPKIEKKMGEDEKCLVEFSSEGIKVELGSGVLYKDIEEALWRWWYYWKDSWYCSGDFKEGSKWRVRVSSVGLDHINDWEAV